MNSFIFTVYLWSSPFESAGTDCVENFSVFDRSIPIFLDAKERKEIPVLHIDESCC